MFQPDKVTSIRCQIVLVVCEINVLGDTMFGKIEPNTVTTSTQWSAKSSSFIAHRNKQGFFDLLWVPKLQVFSVSKL